MAKKLNETSGMPQMSAAFSGWNQLISLTKITQTVSNGFPLDVKTNISVSGTWQPLKAEEIALKPEGQRSWQWVDLHVEGGAPIFITNDRVIYSGKTYKVMGIKDYSLNNYIEYHLVLDYQE